ncbi:MAG: hypothetical protein WBD11_00485 [Xanthobacteraceae bacterium]|jgi:hypothetical protein
MFPNVRLLVVAVLAAIAGIACGLGLFATFRVNHEPLARFAEGGPPLQLAFDKLAPVPDTAAPVAARYPLDGAAKPLSAPILIPPPSLAPDPAEAGSAPGEVSANAEYSTGTAAPADQKDETSVAVVTPDEQSTGAAENIETGQHAADVAAPGEQELDKAPPPIESAGSTTTEAAADSGATDPAAEKIALANSAPQVEEPAVKETKAPAIDVAKPLAKPPAKPLAKAARPAKPARRAINAARIRRTPTTVAAQPAVVWTQPTYQWTDATQRTQTVRRVVVKRHRAAKKAAPAAQSNLTGATAGVLGAQ